MIQRLIELALRRRFVVLLLAVALIVHGVRVLEHARLDVLPDFAPAQVSVQTECPGRTAEQIEMEITRVIESSVQGAVGVATVRSTSQQGLSLVQIVFADGVDPFRARQSISEALTEVSGRLPIDVAPPRLTPLTSATMDLLKFGLLSDTLSPFELRDLAEWTIAPHLLAVPGVAGVSLFGGELRRVEIHVHPDRLAAAGLTLDDVCAAASAAATISASGYAESATQRIVVHTASGIQSLEQLRQAVVGHRAGAPLRLLDVADITEGSAPKFGDCLIQGREGVLLTTTSQYGANTMAVTRAVEAALAELAPTIASKQVTVLPRLHRPATFIEHALSNLSHSLLLGAILVAVILLLFLWDLRAASISLIAIPLSLLTAVIVLDRLGFALDTMALGGLAMALGEVVDDSIIDVENIVRRLQQNALLAAPRRAFAVVLDASIEVRSAVVQATFVVTLVFLPVIGMQGLAGSLFAPLGIAYVVAVGASLLIALTITPALGLILLPRRRTVQHSTKPTLLARTFGKLQNRLLLHPGKLIAVVALLCIWGIAAMTNLGGEFIPPFREGHFVAQMNAAPGTSLEAMKSMGASVSKALLATGHIATVEQQIGRAELGEDPWPPHQSEFHIELKPMPGAQEAEVEDEIRAIFTSFPGVTTEVLTFLGDRLGETLTGETSDIVLTAFGEDLDQLDATGNRLLATLRHTEGMVDTQVAAEPGQPQLAINLRPLDLAAQGLDNREVLDSIAIALQGKVVAQMQDGIRSRDLVVTLAPEQRRDVEALASLRLRTKDQRDVTLASIANVDLVHGRAMILHEGGRRRQVITGNVDGRPQDAVLEELRHTVAAMALPTGVQVTVHGTAEERAEASSQLLEGSLLVGIAVLVLLRSAFRNLRNTLLVLVNLPFAFVGGVLALRVTGSGMDMGALVGFVTLFGITTRNSIMLLSHFEHLVHGEHHPWNAATASLGAQERMRPILMTALVTALGLLPIALARGEAGREIEGPMALVIVGGLCTSTLLNLLVLPALCLRFGNFVRQDAAN